MILLDAILVILFAVIALNFGAYPLLLKFISLFKKDNHKIDPEHKPTVTLLMAAYNEGEELQAKLENSLSLDYPPELFEIFLISDGSTDNTNEIAQQYEDRGVTLMLNHKNQGKATCLNIAIQHIKSDIVVLCDANVMFEPDAIQKLVRHFADPAIGGVSGKVILLNEGLSYSEGENKYYSVEHGIQKLESDTGNLIGADGGMYAIRRELYRPLNPYTFNDDFVLSMGVIQQGKRMVFDGEALGFEKNRSEMDSEYKRKVRIVVGGAQSLQRKDAWPPRDQPLTTLKFFLHKIIRWFIGPAVISFLALFLLRAALTGNSTILFLDGFILIGVLSFTILIKMFPSLINFKPISICNYLLLMITASVVGCYKGFATPQKKMNWS